MGRARTIALVFAGWSVFVWATRVGNVLGDDDPSGLATGARLVFPLAMVALGLHLAWVALVRRDRLAVAVGGLAAWTVILWLVRVPAIVLGGHRAAFVVVHVGLAVLSVALAVLAVESAAAAGRDSGRTAVGR